MHTASGITPAQLTLGVGDLEATEKFYRDALGVPTERVGDTVRCSFGEFVILFELAPPPERAKLELALRVHSAETLETIAGRVGTDTYDRDGGGRALYVTDPDHYTIELFAR